MKRGAYELPHQAQRTMRDLDAEKISGAVKGTARGYTLTDEQLAARVDGRDPGLPYRHLVYSPNASYQSWRAFHTDAELQAWGQAYGLTIARDGTASGDPEPGRTFTVSLPDERVPAYAVVATDRPRVYAGPFGTVEEATAAMLERFPGVAPWDGREVHVAVADLGRYWIDAHAMARPDVVPSGELTATLT